MADEADCAAAGYFGASIWDAFKRTGDKSLKGLINRALDRSSATCVLVGIAIFERPGLCY